MAIQVTRAETATKENAVLVKLAQHAKANFRSFMHIMYPQNSDQQYIIGALHEKLIQIVQDCFDGKINPHQIVSVSPQHGKAASHNTRILTPKGIKMHGEIEIGDEVFHPSGKPIKVVNIIPQTELCSMEVTFSNGEKVKVHPNHEWTVLVGRDKEVTLETKEMLRLGITKEGEKGKRGCRYRFQLPLFDGTEGVKVQLPIDPYFLGVWLGDGAARDLAVGNPDNEIFDGIQYTPSKEWVHKVTGLKYRYFGGHNLLAKLRYLRLIGNKHIPWQYLVTTRENRLELLAGLIDTDGSLSEKTGQYRFINTNEKLIEGVQVLLSSLGYTSSITRAEPTTSSSGIHGNLPVYYIGFTPTEPIPCRVKRKQSTKTVTRRKISIVDIRILPPEEQEEGKCITVDSEDGLYMVGTRMVPTHNSRLLSVRAIAWLIGAKPGLHIAITGFSGDLLADFVGEIKRIVENPRYFLIFGDVKPMAGHDRSNDIIFTNGSNLQARSCGSKLTGRRVDWLVVDDPHAGREEAESPAMRRRVHRWFFADCLSRISQNAKIFLVACMTGDTQVKMADGSDRPLRSIRVGDEIATYDNGELSTSRVLNWINHGCDKVLAITMSSGIVVKANARHPFLVARNGYTEWIKLKDLKTGDMIVRLSPSGAVGRARLAHPKDANVQPYVEACVTPTILKNDGQKVIAPQTLLLEANAKNTCGIATASPMTITMPCLPNKEDVVRCAESLQLRPIIEAEKCSALTTITTQDELEVYSVTSATSQLDMEETPKYCEEQQNTSPFTSDTILSIELCGSEDVFDIEVERTENFIANGLVSHNTRWHPEDLIGHVTGEEGTRQLVDAGYEDWIFEHTNLAAIAESDNDPLGRKAGEALFPEQRPLQFLLGIKAMMPSYEWDSQYMGKPRTASGDQVDVSNIRSITINEVPSNVEWVMAWDLAITEKQSADYTAGALCAIRYEWIDAQEWSDITKSMVAKRKRIEHFYIIEMIRAQKAWAQMRKMILDNSRRVRTMYGVGRIGIEGVSGFDAVYSDVKQELLGELSVDKLLPGKGGKLMRAQLWLNLIQAGRVYLVRGAWNKDFITELSMFPQGTHDDQIDAVSAAFGMLQKRQQKLLIA